MAREGVDESRYRYLRHIHDDLAREHAEAVKLLATTNIEGIDATCVGERLLLNSRVVRLANEILPALANTIVDLEPIYEPTLNSEVLTQTGSDRELADNIPPMTNPMRGPTHADTGLVGSTFDLSYSRPSSLLLRIYHYKPVYNDHLFAPVT